MFVNERRIRIVKYQNFIRIHSIRPNISGEISNVSQGIVRGQLNFPLPVPSSPEGPTPPTSTVQLFATTSRLSPRRISYSEALRPTPKPPEQLRSLRTYSEPPELPDLVGT